MPHPQHETQPSVTKEVSHDWESDTLWVGNNRPAPGGFDLYASCIVFFEKYPASVSGFMLWGAKEVLLPLLSGGETQYKNPEDDEVITYDRVSDTLRLRNSRPAQAQRDIFEGCSVFFDDEEFVSAIVLERAAELLLPVLTAEPEEGGD